MNKADEQIAACVDLKNQSTVKVFYDLVKSYSYKGKKRGYRTNTNFVFFAGAGFSKAWDKDFPEGKELFGSFSDENLLLEKSLKYYLQTMSWCKPETLNKDEFKIDFDDFKKIVFSLEMYEKHRELRPKYIDSKGLKMIRKNLNTLIAFKIWKHTPNPYLQESHNSNNPIIYPPKEPTEKQREIVNFFNILRNQKNNDSQWQEGIRINHITTNYDFVIECIYDAWASEYGGESHLAYVYRGFTPNKYSGFNDIPMVKDYCVVESLFKLNRGLEIYYNPDGTYRVDYRKKEYKNLRNESPLLILPSYEQDYSTPYFIEILQKSKELLTIAKVLIIVGYSLPEEDILIRFLLKHFALDKTDFQDKMIFYINMRENHNKLRKNLKSVFREVINKSFSKQVYTFSGSFNDFVKQFNQLWEPN